MNIYAIVGTKTECSGHGQYDNIKYIPTTGAYGGGPFHPFFVDKDEAERYLKANKLFGAYTIGTVTLCEEAVKND